MALPVIPNQTRAVLRPITIGASAKCENCDKTLRGNFKYRPQQIIVNIFRRGKWKATKHYCPVCYDKLGRPYGEVIE
jgi:hypothetical protein